MKSRKQLFFFFTISLCLLFSLPHFAHAASYYWVGGSGTWDTTTNTHWASSSGGAGGAGVPGSADIALFDGNSGGGTATLGTDISVTTVNMATGYTGTIELDHNLTVSSSLIMTSGAINVGSDSVTITSTNTVGDLTIGASGITKTSGTDATLTLKSGRAIVINHAINAAVSKLSLILNADSGANGDGYIKNTSTITTNGGNVTIGGGSGAITAGSGYAVGDSSQATGVGTGTITAGGGNIVINGKGYNTTTNNNDGIDVGTISTTGTGTITLNGIAQGSSSSSFNYRVLECHCLRA